MEPDNPMPMTGSTQSATQQMPSTQIPYNSPLDSKDDAGGNGMLLAIAGVVLVVLLLGGWFMWQNQSQSSATAEPQVAKSSTQKPVVTVTSVPTVAPDATTQSLMQTSKSDEVTAIDQDVAATDLSGVDAELNSISSDLTNF